MSNYCQYVNVFQGCGKINLPDPDGIAATWHFNKGLCGNTTPAAARPFGKMTCCSYSGGYSAGYGNLKDNYGGHIETMFEGKKLMGFSHLHQSGVGYIKTFYNYALTTPFYGALSQKNNLCTLESESACPGYYATNILEKGIFCELTVSHQVAFHRYTFFRRGGRIAINFGNDGLCQDNPGIFGLPGDAVVTLVDRNTVEASVTLRGLKLYFYVKVEGPIKETKLWADDHELTVSHLKICAGEKRTFGPVFDLEEPATVEIKLSISAKDMAFAKKSVQQEKQNFDQTRISAQQEWEQRLSAIEIETDDCRQKEIFYSNFYHSLIKPSDWSGENFLEPNENDFMVDFATLWDQYKTQIPLIMSLYPDIGRKIVNTFLSYARTLGYMPHTLLLDGFYAQEDFEQAQMLASLTIVDAFDRGIAADYEEALELLLADANRSVGMKEYLETGRCQRIAQTLDIADGCAAIARLALALGKRSIYEVYKNLSSRWKGVFDPYTGLLRTDSLFYEGNHWNYSFHLLFHMQQRVALAGGAKRFADLLDRFFGFSCPDDVSGRFEGFNNETDMETPYAYYYANRHDRLCEVMDACVRFSFTTGEGGIPGNNDSGALSSCFLWNAIGLFPLPGQNRMLIGSCFYPKVTMHLGNGKTLVITTRGKGIYVEKAQWNGVTLSDFAISVEKFMQGGTLILTKTERRP